MKTTPLVRLILLLAAMAGLLIGLQAPTPAHAVTIKGTADVCTVDLGSSWTKGLSKAANKRFSQKVRIHRVSEDGLSSKCDIMVWLSGGTEARPGVAVNPITDEVTNPRYFVYTGKYAAFKAEINVGPAATPKSQRVATMLEALAKAGVR